MTVYEYLGAALADNDSAGLGHLIAVDLDAEPLAGGVAAVLGATSPLLVGGLDGEGELGGVGEGELRRGD